LVFSAYKKDFVGLLGLFYLSSMRVKKYKNNHIYRKGEKSFKSYKVLFIRGIKMFIYGYAHPLTKEIFYVGKTNNLGKRNYAHMRYSKGQNGEFKFFISQLKRKGLAPEHLVLEECIDSIVLEREKYWIEYGLEHKWPLTNKCFGKTIKKNGGQAQIDYNQWLDNKLRSI
jgi:hypothetical protein